MQENNRYREVENRLDIIFSLKRKYGNSIEEIIKYKLELESEIDRIENLEEYNKNLRNQLEKILEQLNIYAKEIHILREKQANILSNKINESLKGLEMKNAKINIHVDYLEEEFFETGKDKIVFYICTNLGEER